MNRRAVLHSLVLLPGIPQIPSIFSTVYTVGDAFMEALREAHIDYVDRIIEDQVLDNRSPAYGSRLNQYGIATPGSSASLILHGTCTYLTAGSAFQGSREFLDRLVFAGEHLLREQHDDGTIDLYSTNFHSTPDVAFVVEPVAIALGLLAKARVDHPLQGVLREFLLRCGEALTIGGIHTPNHRWVVSMALARIHHLMPDQRYLDRIDQWLAEGIDIDDDGQYTERSTSVYSPLTNRCFITMARLLNRPELYQYARRNLDMSLFYFRPNGEVVTESSTRQDQYQQAWPHAYHYPYTYMSILDGSATYAGAALFIRDKVNISQLIRDYPYYLEDENIVDLPTPGPMPSRYSRFFKDSNLVRIRTANLDVTLLAENHVLFSMMKGPIMLQGLRFASAFFGKGQFVGEAVVVEEDGSFSMVQKLEGPYYQPFHQDSISGNGVWDEMPRKNRRQSEVQNYLAKVNIKQVEEAFEVHISIEGTSNVPVAIELNFRESGEIQGAEMIEKDSIYLSTQNQMSYSKDGQTLNISGGNREHSWTQLRGAKPKLIGSSIYITGFTPFDRTLRFS